tara:strand:- start:199 stop:417 length:219 start_codon:yes stop_codon:yes gene_type:complete
LKSGDLVAMVTDSVPVTAAITTKVLVVDITIVKLLMFKLVGLTLSVLQASIAAALESVKDVEDVHPTLMDVT